MSRDIFHQTRVLRALSNLTLNVPRDGASTALLGNLGQGFTTLSVKNFILRASVDLPSVSVKPSPLVLSLHALVTAPLQLSQVPPGTGRLCWGLPRVFSSPGWPAPALPAEGFQPLDHCWGLLQPRSHSSSSVLCSGLQSWTQDSWGVSESPPSPCAHAAGDAARDAAADQVFWSRAASIVSRILPYLRNSNLRVGAEAFREKGLLNQK